MEDYAEASSARLVGGRYRLGRLLGEGGMGTVWLATDELLDRDVAAKQIHLGQLREHEVAAVRSRTLREARIAAKLHHPNIVGVFDVVEQDEPWLIMEYVPSRNLAEQLAGHGTMAASQVAMIGEQIAAALAAAHARGVVHRDIKPANVLLADPETDGTMPAAAVRVTDWGISWTADGTDLTVTNAVLGTPAYFAPEMVRGQKADAASDVYALGATLYECLDGTPPFGRAGDNVWGLLARISRDAVPTARRGGRLAEVVARLTHTDPAARPPAAEAARMLRELLDEQQRRTVDVQPEPERHELAAGPSLPDDPDPAEARLARQREALAAARLERRRAAAAAAARPTSGPSAALAPVRTPVEKSPGAGGPSPAEGSHLRTAVVWATIVLALLWWTDAPDGSPALGAIEIGDPRTADPCSLLDPAALQRLGPVTPLPATGNFGECVQLVQVGAERTDLVRVDVEFGPQLGTTDSWVSGLSDDLVKIVEQFIGTRLGIRDSLWGGSLGGKRTELGDVTLARYERSGDACARRLLLADSTRIFVDAFDYATSPVDLCVVAEAATTAVIGRLGTTGIGRRPTLDSALAQIDTCDLLGPAELTVVPGVDPAATTRRFMGWSCRWGGRKDTPQDAVWVEYDRQAPPDPQRYEPTQIGGRQAFVVSRDDRCLVQVVQRSYMVGDQRRTELVDVFVYGPQASDERCRQATALAAAVAAKLPPPI